MTNRWQSIYTDVQKLLESDSAVLNATVYPRWIAGSRHFWYDRRKPLGAVEYCIVDATTGSTRVAFTSGEIAAAIERRLAIRVDPALLLLRSLEIRLNPDRATFGALDRFWEFDPGQGVLSLVERRADPTWEMSPDGITAIVLGDFNLRARDVATGTERRLTEDGEENNAYGDVPLAFRPYKVRFGRGPEGRWSPDSRYFLTVQTDERHVRDFPLVDYAPEGGGRSSVIRNPTSLPGDPKPTEYRMLALEVATGRQIEARYPRLPAVRMNETVFASGLAWWNKDGTVAYFVDIERGEGRANVVAFDVTTGCCCIVFSEESDTYLELGVSVYARALVEALPESGELIWYSERTGRGHLYLYDLDSGVCKNAITAGDWQVREILQVDARRREVAIKAGGLVAEEDPYLCKPCRVSLDAGPVEILSSGPGDHIIWRSGELSLMLLTMNTGLDTAGVSGFSPDGDFFVETVGAADRLPVSVLRDRSGKQIVTLELADGVALPRNWRWPEPFTVKAADGVTDLHGLLYKPAGFDANRSYPVIDLIYGGPQMGHVPKSAFVQLWPTLTLLELASFAELGAFAFIVDGRGTAEREQKFRTASYGAIETASNLDDHVATVRALAQRYPQIDLERVGITGFSGGGYMAAMAACRYGEIFKVAVACSGNLDQGLFWLGWGERYHGRFETALYERQAVKTYATGLRGKLLLMHGLRDWSVHPATLFQFTQALIDANRDFDLVILPRAAHEVTGYGIRKRLDYLVTYLLDERPDTNIEFSTPAERLGARLAANATAPILA